MTGLRMENWRSYAAAGFGLIALAGGVRARRKLARRQFRFDGRYRETVVLRNGSRVLLRLVRPGDKGLLAAGMKQLSAEGRYRRFHVPKNELTREELKYLTELDWLDHIAIGAMRQDGRRCGLGVARFVRLTNRHDAAEIAIAVADEAQGAGLGKLLLRRLVEAAQERGIRTFVCDVLATNRAFLGLMNAVFPEQTRRYDGPVLRIEARILP